jgi:SPX domain protein involved in polyphosphate accumulation
MQSGKKVIKAEVKRIELDFKIEDHATAVRQESAGAISLRSRRRGPSVTSTEMSNEFSAFVEQEIAKVNSFYALKLDKARRRQVELEAQMEAVEAQQHDRVSSAVDLDKHKNGVGLGLGPVYTITELVPRELQGVQARQRLHKLGTAIGEYYHLLTMLQNYKILNQTALTKLVKKYDKKTNHATLDALKTRLQGEPFVADTTVAALIHDAEKMYGSIHKDPKLAIQRLRTPKSKTSKACRMSHAHCHV